MTTIMLIALLELIAVTLAVLTCRTIRDTDAAWARRTSDAAPKNDAAHDVEANNDARRQSTAAIGDTTRDRSGIDTIDHAGRGGSNP